MTLPSTSLPLRQRAAQWLRARRLFGWLDTLTTDYCDWKPEPPVYERLIR